MEVRAYLKNLQISPRKVRLVADLVRGLDVVKAQQVLTFNDKKCAPYLLKLLNSAIANAENNNSLKKENLYIKTILVDEGFTLKRWKPRAMGRATPIKKRASRITILVAEKKGTKKTTQKKDLPAVAEKAKEGVKKDKKEKNK